MCLSSEQNEAIKQGTEHFFGTAAQISLSGSRPDDNQHGFTLIELIMVIVIIGVLAAVVAPRFFDASIFQSRGFADQVQASLRYAQKEAIAQHRFVCVAFGTNNISLTINTVPSCPGGPLASPSGGATYSVTANPASITFTATPTDFYFDALGKPSLGQPIAINGVTNNIIIEAETGYVHSP
jgi:MSHA pilin protein MshC